MTANDDLILPSLSALAVSDPFGWLKPQTTFISTSDIEDSFFSLKLMTLHIPQSQLAQTQTQAAAASCGARETENMEVPKSSLPVFSPFAVGAVLGCLVTVRLYYLDTPLTPAVQSSCAQVTMTHGQLMHATMDIDSAAVADDDMNAWANTSTTVRDEEEGVIGTCCFDELIVLPIRLCDVPLDASVHCDVYGPGGLIGGITFSPFSVMGELKSGPRLYSLRRNTTHSSSIPSPPSAPRADETEKMKEDYCHLANDEDRVTLPPWELRARCLQNGMMPSIPWLDEVTGQHLDTLRASWPSHARVSETVVDKTETRCDGKERGSAKAVGGEEVTPRSSGFLLVGLPHASVRQPIYHVSAAHEGWWRGCESTVDSSSRSCITAAPPAAVVKASSPASMSSLRATFSATPTQPFVDFHRSAARDRNVSEAAATLLAKSLYLSNLFTDGDVVPGFRERQRLEDIVRRPPIQLDPLRAEDALLLWRHRGYIRRDARFFVPFISSVEWGNKRGGRSKGSNQKNADIGNLGGTSAEAGVSSQQQSSIESQVAAALLPTWKAISLSDVLACLSASFACVLPVRQHAIRYLSLESDARLCHFMAQLVQSVQYDDAAEKELATFLLRRAVSNWEVCSTLYWAVTVEVQLDRSNIRNNNSSNGLGGDAATRQSTLTPLPAPAPPSSSSSSTPALLSLDVYEQLRLRLQETLLTERPYFLIRVRRQQGLLRCLDALERHLEKGSGDRTRRVEDGKAVLRDGSCGFAQLFSTKERGHAAAAAAAMMIGARYDAQDREGRGGVDDDNDEQEQGEAHGREPRGGNGSRSSSSAGAASLSPQSRHVTGVDPAGTVALPTHPSLFVSGVDAEAFFVFKSTTLPMRLSFVTTAETTAALARAVAATTSSAALPLEEVLAEDTETVAAAATSMSTTTVLGVVGGSPLSSASPTPPPSIAAMGDAFTALTVPAFTPIAFAQLFSHRDAVHRRRSIATVDLMYKVRDDVRQDQLVMQLVTLMDSLLRQDGLDLCLTPYRVMATGPTSGLVELVPDVITFQSVQGDVLKHLRKYNPTSERLGEAMNRYTRSFAGYSVITFVLGIGDRHLENILIARDGRLLHVDFGYILGNDPKPFPPPMKINKEMVEVLGGPQSPGYHEFKQYACSAYNLLRKHAPLLLHTLLLMCHSVNMPQVTGNGLADSRVNLLKAQERLRLDLTNTQATQYLQTVIADSVGSVFTHLWDTLHAAAQATRA